MKNKLEKSVNNEKLCEFAKDYILNHYARTGNEAYGVEINGEGIISDSLPSGDYDGSYSWFTIHESKVLRTFIFKKDNVNEEYVVRVDALLTTSNGYFNCHTNTEEESKPEAEIKNYRVFIERYEKSNELFVETVEEHKEDEEEWKKFCAQSSTFITS